MDSQLLERPLADDLDHDLGLDQAVADFLPVRSRLLGIAIRVIGSSDDAEDVVQEVWIRWQRVDRSVARNPTAFLVTATTRLALNVAQSAHHRRETNAEPLGAGTRRPQPGATEHLGGQPGGRLGGAGADAEAHPRPASRLRPP